MLIRLISEDKEGEIFRILGVGLSEEVLPPKGQVLKAASISDVIDQYASLSSSVKSYSKRLIPFLTSSIPDLQGHSLRFFSISLNLKFLRVEICSDCRLVYLGYALADVTTCKDKRHPLFTC